jgi:hypothetical protein
MCTSMSLFLQVHNLLEYGCSVYHGISMNLLHGLLLAVILYVQDHLNKIMKGGVKAVTSAMAMASWGLIPRLVEIISS